MQSNRSSISTRIQGKEGGAINLAAENIALSGYGGISTTTGGGYGPSNYAAVPGGAINLETANLTITDYASINTSRLSLDNGGSISIRAMDIFVDGGGIASRPTEEMPGTYGYGGYVNYGGDISVVASGDIVFARGGVETSSTGYYGQAGGNISIVGNLITLSRDGLIRATANEGGGDGGAIEVSGSFLVVGANGLIQTTAVQGDGGPITLNVDALVAAPGAQIDADSEIGANGRIAIGGQQLLNMTETADLNSSFLDASAIIGNPCLAALLGSSELILSAENVGGSNYATNPPASLLQGVLAPVETMVISGPAEITRCGDVE